MLNEDIIKIVSEGVNEQEELLSRLRSLGYKITQPSVSRRLKSLGIIKLNGKYQLNKTSGANNIKIFFIKPNLFVIKTLPGHASLFATIIDDKLIENLDTPEFVGSVAGDDTIFIAVNLNDRDHAWAENQITNLIK